MCRFLVFFNFVYYKRRVVLFVGVLLLNEFQVSIALCMNLPVFQKGLFVDFSVSHTSLQNRNQQHKLFTSMPNNWLQNNLGLTQMSCLNKCYISVHRNINVINGLSKINEQDQTDQLICCSQLINFAVDSKSINQFILHLLQQIYLFNYTFKYFDLLATVQIQCIQQEKQQKYCWGWEEYLDITLRFGEKYACIVQNTKVQQDF
eukprot:TRINITY_DN5274_c1_g2_i1.p1 TRINITY_DN5274_c1_g2~~TRINITY_DN5274_c1_g2_i1.p1  ORF type:complete len:204 (-),score=-13.10 TRINITY_DN5274_c1_g2_i1:198-809(-)